MGTLVAYDAIHMNIGALPRHAQVAGYTTGTPDIQWTSADWSAHPGAVRIDQDFAASDPSADVLDVERGAATFADCPVWSKLAVKDFDSVNRAGQRMPAIYASQSNLTGVANALVSGGVNSGVGLFVADWGLSLAQAISLIENAGGPFPVIGVQYSNGLSYDFDVFSTNWLTNVSGAKVINPVTGLEVRRGFTSIYIVWTPAKGATGYTVKTYWRGGLVEEQNVIASAVRIGHLSPMRTYEIKVRAHPSGSQGADATIKVTTR